MEMNSTPSQKYKSRPISLTPPPESSSLDSGSIKEKEYDTPENYIFEYLIYDNNKTKIIRFFR